jgi:hypothetical protein
MTERSLVKLTDDAVSRLPLEAGRAELLEEIMSTVAPDRRDPDTLADPAPREPRRLRWVAPVAAAAVVAGLATGTLWWQQHRPSGDDSDRVASTLGLPQGKAVVLDAPGWKVDSLSGDGLVFRNGAANLEITSYAAKDYDSYVLDREYIVDPPAPGEPIQVLGRPAQMWAYSGNDHTAIREVEDGRWMEFRAEGVDRAGYLALLKQLRFTTDAEFDAALPDDYVTSDERQAAADRIIGEIRDVSGAGFPDGAPFQIADGDDEDNYQFGAEVVGLYTCAWLEAFENAETHGQDAPAAEAARVLGTSRQWPVLKEMDADGDYPEVVWDYADTVAAGTVPEGYREGLGCSGASGPAAPSADPS